MYNNEKAVFESTTNVEIVEMHRLYNELGNAAEAARRMDRSATTVRRYLQMKDCPVVLRYATKELIRMV